MLSVTYIDVAIFVDDLDKQAFRQRITMLCPPTPTLLLSFQSKTCQMQVSHWLTPLHVKWLAVGSFCNCIFKRGVVKLKMQLLYKACSDILDKNENTLKDKQFVISCRDIHKTFTVHGYP